MSLPLTADEHQASTRSKRRTQEEALGVEEVVRNSRNVELKESWKSKLKKVFCQGIDIKDQNYKLHCENKIIRTQNKEIMRNLGIPVASGSEGHLTASAEWKGKYSDFDDDATSSRPATQIPGGR
jgi:hypothetical protein